MSDLEKEFDQWETIEKLAFGDLLHDSVEDPHWCGFHKIDYVNLPEEDLPRAHQALLKEIREDPEIFRMYMKRNGYTK